MKAYITVEELYFKLRSAGSVEIPVLREISPYLTRSPGLRLKDLAKHLEVKPSELSAAIHLLTGETFDALLNKWRMYKALDLLKDTELTLEQVAEQSGYSQYKHLAKAMKRELQMTPFEYRHGYRRTVERPHANERRLQA